MDFKVYFLVEPDVFDKDMTQKTHTKSPIDLLVDFLDVYFLKCLRDIPEGI